MNAISLVLLFSLVAPLPLLIIEKFLPYSFIIEELLSLIFVFILLGVQKDTKRNVLPFVILSGLLFTISEDIFYLVNIFAVSQNVLLVFFQRLFLTGILHIGTILIIYLFARKKRNWWLIGFIIAVLIHFFFNYLVSMS